MGYDAAAVIALLMLVTALAMLAGFRELNVVRDPLYSACLAASWFLYLGWCWRRGGMTVGMRAWRVRLETLQGGPPGWGACLVRFLVSLLAPASCGRCSTRNAAAGTTSRAAPGCCAPDRHGQRPAPPYARPRQTERRSASTAATASNTIGTEMVSEGGMS
jgi:hypothetical protein